MNKESSRHHYLPVFYIKNFCNSNGEIFINDKLNDKNYGNISRKVPKKIFFEWDGNTYNINGVDSTIVETLYGYLEDKIAPFLEKLNNLPETESAINKIDVETLRNLIFLGYLTKWRIPSNDEYVKKLDSEISFDDLNIFVKEGDSLFSLNSLVYSEISPEIKRMFFSARLFKDSNSYSNVFKNTFIIYFPQPLFINDNPFIELQIDSEKEYPSFIFPLSSNHLLVHCDFINKYEFIDFFKDEDEKYYRYLNYLYNCVLITIMWHGKKYIGCENREPLSHMLSVVNEVSDKIEEKGVSAPYMAFNALRNFRTFD